MVAEITTLAFKASSLNRSDMNTVEAQGVEPQLKDYQSLVLTVRLYFC